MGVMEGDTRSLDFGSYNLKRSVGVLRCKKARKLPSSQVRTRATFARRRGHCSDVSCRHSQSLGGCRV